MERLINNIEDWERLTQVVADRFKKSTAPFFIEIGAPPITLEQFGYFHVEVLPKLAIAAFDAGEIDKRSESKAKAFAKRQINFGEWKPENVGFEDPDTGEIFYKEVQIFKLHSFKDKKRATKEIMSEAIEFAIEFCREHHVIVNPPPKTEEKKNAN